MRRISLSAIVMIVWALWLGGLATLFMLVTRLFKEHNDLFHQAAPVIFQMFEQYQIVVAGVALVVSFVFFLAEKRASRLVLFILFSVSAGGSVVNSVILTPAMEKIRLDGGAGSPAFMKLHGESMLIYLSELVLLVIGGWVIAKASIPLPRIPRSEG